MSDLAYPYESDLPRSRHTVLFADVVESVRIMERHEESFVRVWLAFLDYLRGELLPRYGGRMVKSHGDGVLLAFDAPHPAVQCALQMQQRVAQLGSHMPADSPILLRVGIHTSDVVVQDFDLFGAGVNLAARLAALAEPGAILLSSEAREPLVDGFGLHLRDTGPHWLKHVDQAVRVFEVTPCAAARAPKAAALESRPGIAVLPFRRLTGGDALPGLGQAIADDLTVALSRCPMWRVISRLSTARCHALEPGADVAKLLGVPYIVSGSYRNLGHGVRLNVELHDTRDGSTPWAEQFQFKVQDLFAGQDQALHTVVQTLARQVLNIELARSGSLPFSQLEDYCLHLSAIRLMHRLSPYDFNRARDLIDALETRHRRSAEPAAMRTRWHALRMVQGWGEDTASELRLALNWARRAVERDPVHAFALPMSALMAAQLGEPLLPALADAQCAMSANPQEPMAGLAFAILRGYLGDVIDFEHHCDESANLTPLDPAVYVYSTMLSSAKLSAGKVGEAIEAAARAIRANVTYSTAHMMMAAAQAMAGNDRSARESAAHLLSLEPGFRVSRYMNEFSGRQPPNAADRQRALLAAGLPA